MFGNYVDRTCDVQTAAVAMVQTFPNPDLTKDSHVISWITAYRDLLDSWRMWHQRLVITSLFTSLFLYLNLVKLVIYILLVFLHRIILCFESAEFDIFRNKKNKMAIGEQVIVGCNFCMKPIGYDAIANRNAMMASAVHGSGPPVKPKVSSMPSKIGTLLFR